MQRAHVGDQRDNGEFVGVFEVQFENQQATIFGCRFLAHVERHRHAPRRPPFDAKCFVDDGASVVGLGTPQSPHFAIRPAAALPDRPAKQVSPPNSCANALEEEDENEKL